MMDAEVRSEERYSRLSIAYDASEKEQVNNCINTIVAKYTIEPNIHTTASSSGKTVVVVEYHDDLDRESGAIFEEILKELQIHECN